MGSQRSRKHLPTLLLSGGRSHTLKGSRIDDAADAAELEFGKAFQDGDGVAVEVRSLTEEPIMMTSMPVATISANNVDCVACQLFVTALESQEMSHLRQMPLLPACDLIHW